MALKTRFPDPSEKLRKENPELATYLADLIRTLSDSEERGGLHDISDTDISAPSSGDLFTYNGQSTFWEAGTFDYLTSASIINLVSVQGYLTSASASVAYLLRTSANLNSLIDVSVAASVADGWGLFFHSSASAWQPSEVQTVSAATTASAGTVEIATDAEIQAGTVTGGSGASLVATPDKLGLVLLATATASASASIDFTTGIDATYEEYELHIINAVPATDNAAPWLRTSTDGGSTFDAGASDYKYNGTSSISSGSAFAASSNNGTTRILLAAVGIDNAAGGGFSAIVKLYNPANTARKTEVAWNSGGALRGGGANVVSFQAGYAIRTSAADVDAVRFLMSTGNITSGEFKLYGVRK